MLQMSCPNCKGVIQSPFLAEVSMIECCHCADDVPVKDVVIATEYFIVPRKDLTNRMIRFQKLLREVEKERRLMAENNEVHAENLEKLDQFSLSLQELLAGARDSYRMEILCDLYVEVTAHNRSNQGRLVNLSTDGASIEFVALDKVPRKKSELKLGVTFPESAEKLLIQAKVVWTREQIHASGSQQVIIGVAFMDIDKGTHSCLWNYILDNTPAPFLDGIK